mgnify:CR=1 FL=1|tara:strand:+ start:187 stop:423 length:237 start_codon:yes stop_codon:yes gene_type:complete
MKLKINNVIKNPAWKEIKCKCGKQRIDKYPLITCIHCKCQEQFDSCPTETFSNNGKTVKEITLINGKYDDIIAWSWNN